MKKYLILFIAVFSFQILSAQSQVIFTQKDWDKHLKDDDKIKKENERLVEENKRLAARTKEAEDSLRIIKFAFTQVLETNRKGAEDVDRAERALAQIDSLDQVIASRQAMISAKDQEVLLAKESAANSDYSRDVNTCKYALANLYMVYDEERVNNRIKELEQITNPEIIKEYDLDQVIPLLKIYSETNGELRDIFVRLHNDKSRLDFNNAASFKSKWKGEIMGTDYYKKYYLNRNKNDIWTINYLDDIITGVLETLERHNGRSICIDMTLVTKLMPKTSFTPKKTVIATGKKVKEEAPSQVISAPGENAVDNYGEDIDLEDKGESQPETNIPATKSGVEPIPSSSPDKTNEVKTDAPATVTKTVDGGIEQIGGAVAEPQKNQEKKDNGKKKNKDKKENKDNKAEQNKNFNPATQANTGTSTEMPKGESTKADK